MLSDYQKGSIFGATLVGIAFAFSFATYRQPAETVSQTHSGDVNTERKNETFWQRVGGDPLNVFTLSLVVVGGIQAGLFLWQLDIIRKSLVDAEKAANAAAEAARAATDQADIAKRTFLDRERPYIFAFEVQYIKQSNWAGPLYPFCVSYSVANYGNMPAIIQRAFIEVVCGRKTDPPYPGAAFVGNRLMSSPILPAQERRTGLTELIPREFITGTTHAIITDEAVPGGPFVFPEWKIPAGEDIFLEIIIQYDGPFSMGHETRATWICHMGRQEFITWGGENYNYTR